MKRITLLFLVVALSGCDMWKQSKDVVESYLATANRVCAEPVQLTLSVNSLGFETFTATCPKVNATLTNYLKEKE